MDEQNVFELRIEHACDLSWIELREVVEIIDSYILERVLRDITAPYFDPRRIDPRIVIRQIIDLPSNYSDEISFVQIRSVNPGCITFLITTGAAMFTLAAIGRGVTKSNLPGQLVDFGENVGNILAAGLETVNEKLRRWNDVSNKLRNRNTHVKIRRLEDKSRKHEQQE